VKHVIQTALLAAALLAAAPPALAQDFPPKKTVTLVVGLVPGGAMDVSARLIAKKLGENIGQSVVVENRSGAGGNIAHQQVATGPSDGSVLLYGSVGPLTIAPHLMELPYDPFTDLAPISGSVYFPTVLIVHKGMGVNTLAEFVQRAKNEPGSVSYASSGAGSGSHLTGELLSLRAGIDMIHVPYKGGSQVMQDLLGERVDGFFSSPPTAVPQVEAGKVVALATTGLTRPAYLPDIPTVAESGYPGFEALNWYAFVASAKTPKALLARWNAEIVKVLHDPEVVAALTQLGLTPHPTTPAELTDFMKKEYDQWGAIVRARDIAPK